MLDAAMLLNEEPDHRSEASTFLLPPHGRACGADPAMLRNHEPEPLNQVTAALFPRCPRPGRADPPMMLKDQPQHEIAPALRPSVEAWPQWTETLVQLQGRCEAGAPLPVVDPTATGLG